MYLTEDDFKTKVTDLIQLVNDTSGEYEKINHTIVLYKCINDNLNIYFSKKWVSFAMTTYNKINEITYYLNNKKSDELTMKLIHELKLTKQIIIELLKTVSINDFVNANIAIDGQTPIEICLDIVKSLIKSKTDPEEYILDYVI